MNSKAPFLYKLSKIVLGPIFKWNYNPTIIGKENIPASGKCLLAGTHIYDFDPILIMASTKYLPLYFTFPITVLGS